MRPLAFHRHAANYLRRMPADRKAQVLEALEPLRTVADPVTNPNVKAMLGKWAGALRLRVGSLRVIFRIAQTPDGSEVLDVLQVGPRGDIYK
jgi:mRNA-degrading endonuclease RelE of RelBE toxin-antitoxin system